MKAKLLSVLISSVLLNGAAHAAPVNGENSKRLGTDTTGFENKTVGLIDIEQMRKRAQVPNMSDAELDKIRKTNLGILDEAKVADSEEIPEEVQIKQNQIDNLRLPKPKVPNYVNDKTLENQRGGIDLERITKQYNDALLANKKSPADSLSDFEAGRGYLFISATIPKQTLERLLNDAGRLGIAVFLKGNIGPDPLKFAGTQAFMDKLKISTPPELFIHPDAFKMFKIDRVPALVVAASDVKDNLDEQGCADLTDYDIIYGDLKLGYNLTQIFEKASSPDIKDIARGYMKNINVSDAAKQ